MYTAEQLNGRTCEYNLWERLNIYLDFRSCVKKCNERIIIANQMGLKSIEYRYYASMGLECRPYNCKILQEKVEDYYNELGYYCRVLVENDSQVVQIDVRW